MDSNTKVGVNNMSVTLTKPVLNRVPAHLDPDTDAAILEHHIVGVLRTMNIELTSTNIWFERGRARKAHKYFYGNSNLTDWRLYNMNTPDIIIMMHKYTQEQKRMQN